MFKNHISPITPKRNPNSHPQFFIRRSEIAFDERLAFVENVCATLIESRFGPGRVEPVIVDFSDRPEPEETIFYDLSDAEMVQSYFFSPLGRAGYQVIEAAYRRAKQMGLLDGGPNEFNSAAALPPNQGRGSP